MRRSLPGGMAVAVLVVLSCVSAGSTLSAAAAVDLEGTAPVVDALAALRGEFITTGGQPIEIQSDGGDLGERTITGVTSDGSPVQILIQSTAVTDEERELVAATTSEAASAEMPGFTEWPVSSQSGVIEAAPLSADSSEWEIVSVIAFTDASASFASPNQEEFSVYEGGDLLGVSSGGQYLAEDLDEGEVYTFSMHSATNGPSSGSGESNLALTRTITFSTFTGVENVDEPRLIAPMTYQPWYNQYVHKTFIPDARVGGFQCHLPDVFNNWEFGGDNRGFRTPSSATPWDEPNYRTMMFVNVNWDNPYPYDIGWTKNVGATPVYKNGVRDRTLYASMDAMTFHDGQAGASYAKIRLQHFASNPGCSLMDFNYSGAITYGELVEFYRSGTIAVEGSRFRAPAHEMYAGFTPASGSHVIWKSLARLENENFICLLGTLFCHPEFYNVRASY